MECSTQTLPKFAKSGESYYHLDTFARNVRETFVQQSEEHHNFETPVTVDVNAWTSIMYTECSLYMYGRAQRMSLKFVKDEAALKRESEEDERIIKENFYRLSKLKSGVTME